MGLLTKLKTGILSVKYNAAIKMNLMLWPQTHILLLPPLSSLLWLPWLPGSNMCMTVPKSCSDAVSDLMKIFGDVASLIMNDLVKAFTNGGGEADKLGKQSQSMAQSFDKMAKIVGKRSCSSYRRTGYSPSRPLGSLFALALNIMKFFSKQLKWLPTLSRLALSMLCYQQKKPLKKL